MILSDHINIKCSTRVATDEHPVVTDAPLINCDVPDVTRNVSLKCPYCDYKGKCPADLTIHVRFHTGERPYECNLSCRYRAHTVGDINKHNKTCTGPQPPLVMLRCPRSVCPFHTYVKSLFDNHIKTCGTKPMVGQFKCVECHVA